MEPPPIAQEIDIHVIDLMTLKRVGNMLRAHKAYTPSTECFFIFLDVCDDYVARFVFIKLKVTMFLLKKNLFFILVVLKICMPICGIVIMASPWRNINILMW